MNSDSKSGGARLTASKSANRDRSYVAATAADYYRSLRTWLRFRHANEIEAYAGGVGVRLDKTRMYFLAVIALLAAAMVLATILQVLSMSSHRGKAQSVVAASADAWKYSALQDALTGEGVMSASVVSSNRNNLDGLQSNEVSASLMIMKMTDGSTPVYFTVAAGQMPCRGAQTCRVMVQAGDDAPVAFDATVPSDGDSRRLYLHDNARFVAALHRADRIAVTVSLLHEGNRVWTFDTRNFSI